MALQLALTTLESLAEMLNERKREAEQFAAFRDKMRSISGKFAARSLQQASHQAAQMGGGAGSGLVGRDGGPGSGDSPTSVNGERGGGAGGGTRFLLKEDDVTQLVRLGISRVDSI